MKLTNNEIQHIEKYLDKKGIVYVDLRFEILDHIILQIEEEININGLDFNAAFNQVTKQWNLNFRETTSLLFRVMYSAPKLIIEKAKKIYLKYFTIIMLSIFLIPFFKTEIEVSTNLNYVLKGVMFLLIIISFIKLNKIRKSNKKTVYSFIAKTQMAGIITYPIVIFVIYDFIYPALGILFNICVFFYCSLVFLRKHKKIIKQVS